MVYTWLEIDNNASETVRSFLHSLMERGVVDAVLVPMPTPGGASAIPTLVSDPQKLAQAEPLAPVMPVSEATMVALLTRTGAPRRLGVLLRNCQIRALVELAKFKQAYLDDVLIIGVDCPGTYEVADYAALVGEGVNPTVELLAGIAQGNPAPYESKSFRGACSMCVYPIP
ncbi:MAG TPA: formate dehydrogenase, partial [Chloroflexi bacterium]|nr:formate dehydrogenase [Chloroflexota bacterium]